MISFVFYDSDLYILLEELYKFYLGPLYYLETLFLTTTTTTTNNNNNNNNNNNPSKF